jgi:pimeloyl-ACP methyl ester carboxylesterase
MTIYRYFISTPIIGAIRKSNLANEIYFNNEMGGYIWEPKDGTVGVYEHLLIFCAGFDGNASGRFAIIRKLQNLFPKYTIIILDYPSFGISYTLDFSMKNVVSKVTETVNSILESNTVSTLHLMGETIGCYIISRILSHELNVLPKSILFLNPVHDICSYYVSRFGWICFPFLLPSLLYRKTKITKPIENFAIIYNKNDSVFEKQAFDTLFYHNCTSMDRLKIAQIEGDGLTSFLLPINHKKLNYLTDILFKE